MRHNNTPVIPHEGPRISFFKAGSIEVVTVAIRLIVFAIAVTAAGGAAAQTTRELRWAGDPEGGAPFVQADPARPDEVVGFDVEIATLLARA